jgi:hypothetical protein
MSAAYDRLRERLESTRGGFLTDLEVSVSDLEALLDEIGDSYEYGILAVSKWSGTPSEPDADEWMGEEEARDELSFCLKNNELRMHMGRKLYDKFGLVRRRKAGEIEFVEAARALP